MREPFLSLFGRQRARRCVRAASAFSSTIHHRPANVGEQPVHIKHTLLHIYFGGYQFYTLLLNSFPAWRPAGCFHYAGCSDRTAQRCTLCTVCGWVCRSLRPSHHSIAHFLFSLYMYLLRCLWACGAMCVLFSCGWQHEFVWWVCYL